MLQPIERPVRPRRDWATPAWPDDQRLYAKLLEALTRDLIEIAGTERQIVAHAEVNPDEMAENQARLEREELDESHRELGSFRTALDEARAAGEGAEVPFDAGDPRQDDLADALIQYLVRPGYAAVRTEERAPGRYVYHVQVDWPKLRSLAGELGYNL